MWAIVYWIFYPAWPTVSGYTRGVLGYTNRAQVSADLADLQKVRGGEGRGARRKYRSPISRRTRRCWRFAQAQGKAAFGNNCAPCHGVGATGAKGYPNLNDDDWLWGGTLDQIKQTIEHGVRSGDAKDHESAMPAFGKMSMLKPDEIVTVANYVRSLSGLSVRPGSDRAAGKKIFAENCAACHGADGKGNQELGAPNLTDKIWLYGSSEADHRRDHHQQPWRRDAGLGRPARSRDHQCAHGLRAYARRGQMRHHCWCRVPGRRAPRCKSRRGVRRVMTRTP